MNYVEILKAREEAKRHGVRTLRTDTTIRFFPNEYFIRDTKGNTYRYKPDKTLRIKGNYRLLSLVGVIRACVLRSALDQRVSRNL